MRLQEVYFVCRKTYNVWPELEFGEKRTPSGTVYYNLMNADEVRTILKLLEPIQSFNNVIRDIRKTSIEFTQTTKNIAFDSSNKARLISFYTQLKTGVKTIVEMLESMKYGLADEGIDIKLPPSISLLELSKCTRDLNTVFSTCPMLTKEDARIELVSVDVGSIWLALSICGAGTLILAKIAKLVDQAVIIRSHYLTAKQQQEQIRRLELDNAYIQKADEINEAVEKKLLEKITAQLAEEESLDDPEDVERLKNSLKLLSDWMKKGMEIHASLPSPEDAKALFPSLEKQAIPVESLTLLTDDTQ